jgi:hypothetical protein
MTSMQQRAALQRQIWAIANDVRGSEDGWDFKHYVLGTLFYRFISENFSAYIEAGDENIHYAQLSDSVITPDIKDDAIKTKGYFIYPSQLFVNVAKHANTNESLNTDLAAIFSATESSVNGYPSEVPQAAALFPAELLQAVPWGHHAELMAKVKDLPIRRWYMQAAVNNGWSRNLSQRVIAGQARNDAWGDNNVEVKA